VPVVEDPVDFEDWLAGVGKPEEGERRLTLSPASDVALKSMSPPPDAVLLLVGPEGGLDRTEVQMAASRSFEGVRLGPRILRTETAAVAALAAIQTLWGDF
jgi:16S rRNA (uracil1498-N3)-methyltransferase